MRDYIHNSPMTSFNFKERNSKAFNDDSYHGHQNYAIEPRSILQVGGEFASAGHTNNNTSSLPGLWDTQQQKLQQQDLLLNIMAHSKIRDDDFEVEKLLGVLDSTESLSSSEFNVAIDPSKDDDLFFSSLLEPTPIGPRGVQKALVAEEVLVTNNSWFTHNPGSLQEASSMLQNNLGQPRDDEPSSFLKNSTSPTADYLCSTLNRNSTKRQLVAMKDDTHHVNMSEGMINDISSADLSQSIGKRRRLTWEAAPAPLSYNQVNDLLSLSISAPQIQGQLPELSGSLKVPSFPSFSPDAVAASLHEQSINSACSTSSTPTKASSPLLSSQMKSRSPCNYGDSDGCASVTSSSSSTGSSKQEKSPSAQDSNQQEFYQYQEDQWNERLNELVEFKKEHGHCLVPHSYPQNNKLAQWVKRQRYQLKLKKLKQHHTLTDARQTILQDLGFVWDSHKAAWFEKFEGLKAFKMMNGHLNVPCCHQSLATWIKCQRRQYRLFCDGKKSTMNNERIQQLDNLGFDWNPRNI